MNDLWEAIQQERAYQDKRFGKAKHEIPGWVLIIKKQLDTAVMHWLDGEPDMALAEILQSTAVGVACLEQHGVPVTSYRHPTTEEVLGIPQDTPVVKEDLEHLTTKKMTEVTVVNFEHLKTYQLSSGYIVIQVYELEDEKEQEALMRFMRGQTMPLIVGYGALVYLHDYQNFLAKGQLFWD